MTDLRKIIIDGMELEVDPRLTLLQACELAGVEIPRFCYHERLSIAGNCRMCLVEVVGGPPKPAASLALLADRTVWTWGGGTQNGRGGADSAQPLALPQPQGVAELAASAGHVLLRLANGQVWGWGGNGSAELGDGSRLDRPSPVQAVGILL